MKSQSTRLAAITFLLCALALTVFSAANSVTLDSSRPMGEQIQAFIQWYGELDPRDKAQWDAALDRMAELRGAQEDMRVGFADFSSGTVYVLPKGKVYHLSADCRYVRSNPEASGMALEDAVGAGYERACSVCGD